MILEGATMLAALCTAGCGIYTVKLLKKLSEAREDEERKILDGKKKERLERQWDALMTYNGGKTDGRNDAEE